MRRLGRGAIGAILGLLLVHGSAGAVWAPGARIVEGPGDVAVQDQARVLVPDPGVAYSDVGKQQTDGCQLQAGEVEPVWCVHGHPDSDTTVLLVGDSTAAHHFSALEPVANLRDWKLVTMTKAGCSLSLFPRREECETWQEKLFQLIEAEHFDMVITAGVSYIPGWAVGAADGPAGATDDIEAGWEAAFERLVATGSKIVLMASGPLPPIDVTRCVTEHRDDLRACALPREEALGYPHTDVQAAKRVPGVTILRTNPFLCNRRRCPAVIGNVLVYRGHFHLTATWGESMAGHVDDRLPYP